MSRTIVVGVDDQPPSIRALRRAIDLAARLEAELHAVHVTYIPGTLLSLLSQVPTDLERLERTEEARVWEALHPIVDAAPIPVHEVTLHGYPPERLVDHCREVGAELLVVGTRGRGELAALFLGSTAHRVLHEAPCDVLVVKGSDEAEGDDVAGT